MPTPSINVTVTFTMVSGTLSWTVAPNPVSVPNGKQMIVWNLTGTPGAKFATKGIVPGTPPWRGANPTRVSATQWQSPSQLTSTKARKSFTYKIKVVYNGMTYSLTWPQIENQPTGGNT